ncbi:MAG TPA: hypothetical protein P5229_01465 [Candidatus Gracilibacteria bacterium]|nr:hypothetical protein [Candidatus Gracilibacteria bacterium]HRY90992.1 hypothetical protein [Candidatus Gracilibacteria bacterium]
MPKKTTITITFTPEEKIFYDAIQKYANEKNLSMEDYIKQMLKINVTWGHFRQKKKGST